MGHIIGKMLLQNYESLGQKILTIDSPEEEDDVTSVLNPSVRYNFQPVSYKSDYQFSFFKIR